MPRAHIWDDIPDDSRDYRSVLRSFGEAGVAIAEHDWARTPLGSIDSWPAHLRSVVSTLVASGQPMALCYGPRLTTIFNAAFRPILGARAPHALGKPFCDIWFDVWDDISPMVREALSGKTIWRDDLTLFMTRNGYPEETHWCFSYSPVFDEDGRIAGFIDVVTETTALVTARRDELAWREEQRVLQNELSHRMKNMLAVVQSIVAQTVRNAGSLPEAATAISERLNALARAQDLLTHMAGETADLRRLVLSGLAPYGPSAGRVLLDGPDIVLGSQQALAIALAIHELATNATKYGALSNADGKVSIRWARDAETLHFAWNESDGPYVTKPSRKGFGSRLVEKIVPAYFAGKSDLRYETTGIAFSLVGTLTASSSARV